MRRILIVVVALSGLLVLGWGGTVVLRGTGAGHALPQADAARQAPAGGPIAAADLELPGVALERARLAAAAATSGTQAAAGDATVANAAMPLRLVVDELAELEEQAAAGDRVAACRAAGSLALCRSVRGVSAERHQRLLVRARERMESASDQGNARMWAERKVRSLERELELLEQCRGVDEDLLALQPYLDVRAARLGDPHAAMRFVSGTGIGAANLATDPSLGAYYREHAWPLFQQMLERGDETAVWVWAQAVIARSDALFWTVMPEEWNRPEVVRGLARRLHERRNGNAQQPPDPQFEALDPDAEREAEALFQQYFSGPARDLRPEFEDPLPDPARRCAELAE